MEVKVSVDGIPRVVCGVTEKTTYQEVVVALAQSLGRPGRYTLKEKFKDFERSVTPSERLLESLEKYGQQARDVQLTLLHNGPSLWEGAARARGGRYLAGPTPLRSVDAGGRVRRDSTAPSLHRQSLPPISRLRQQADQPPEEMKRPKRKSLTLMEEAWGWLENLGRGSSQQSSRDKGSNKQEGVRNDSSLDVSVTVAKDVSVPRGLRSKTKSVKSGKSVEKQQISCCMRDQGKNRPNSTTGSCDENKEGKDGNVSPAHTDSNTGRTKVVDLINPSGASKIEEDKRKLKHIITLQQVSLQGLQAQITSTERQICELEAHQRAKKAGQEAQLKTIEEETEQLQFWENELKAEEGFEKDLQAQFLEMREKAVECKARLEEYKCKMAGLDLGRVQRTRPEGKEMAPTADLTTGSVESMDIPNKEVNQQRSSAACEVNTDRKLPPREDCNVPTALISTNQIKDPNASRANQLREWWTHWSEAQSPKPEAKHKVVHRSEITIHLGSTRV
ncbi:ras association domain-containing protein 8 [Osmerus mordax]|uniref:ras association domain-containing protein 8 n=1 Tax=Osmerus mordax TaxID=8014 RepID=UPI003510A943